VIGLVLRVALWFAFGRKGQVAPLGLGWILPVGAVNDIVAALYLFLPLSLYLCLLPDRACRSATNRTILLSGSFITALVLVYLAAVEFYFFQEFDERFNLVATDYLIYPKEVFTDIRESYPVAPVLVMAAAIAAVAVWLLRRPLLTPATSDSRLRERLVPLALHVLLVVGLLVGLRTDSLVHTGNRIAAQLAINGHSQFFQALRTSEIDYEAYYVSGDPKAGYDRLVAQLGTGGGTFVQLPEQKLEREFAPSASPLGHLNVIVVMEESFGAEFSKLHGSSTDLTPFFDRYARQGIWFSNMYAQGTRTVRGLEAITASFPPIPTVSIVRRPGNDHIATWGKVMREAGYSTTFLYGGFGYFDNMNAFFGDNGYDVVDRREIKNPRFANIWGVSDEDLFDTTLATMDQKAALGRPFFAQVMTTSNHKPFTFRDGLPGIPPEGGGRSAGVRYADFALGYFLEQARKHSWFDSTVFVVVADHGARVYGRAEIPLRTYEIPCLILAPKHIRPQQIDTLASQIDIAPTVLGLLGFGYRAPFFGQDLLSHPDAPRVALFNHNHDVALYRDGRLVVLGLQHQLNNYSYDRALDAMKPAPHDPELEALATAYFQTASELFRTHRYE
jgi:phosphoglycerol transferase MdoB-like AlkP superfamily enzyme